MIASTVNILISRNNRVKFPPRFLLSLLFVNFHPTPNFHSFHSRPFKTVRRIDLYLSRPMHLSLLMVKLDDTRGLTFKNDSLYYDIIFTIQWKASLISFIRSLTSIKSTITRIDETYSLVFQTSLILSIQFVIHNWIVISRDGTHAKEKSVDRAFFLTGWERLLFRIDTSES